MPIFVKASTRAKAYTRNAPKSAIKTYLRAEENAGDADPYENQSQR